MARAEIRARGYNPTPAERQMIQVAIDDAERMAVRALRDLNGSVWAQRGRPMRRRSGRRRAWASHPALPRWFGVSTRHIEIRRLRRRMNRIHEWLKGPRIVVKTHANGDRSCDGANAFTVWPRRVIRVNLCPPWFAGGTGGAAPGASSTAASRRAAIIIHELVHELGFGHPEGATNPAAALALANRNSRRARRSPENFEHYYERFF